MRGTEEQKLRFIIVDDDRINNMVCSIAIKNSGEGKDVHCFYSPEESLEMIRNNLSQDTQTHTILLLDLNMPTMTGWEWLEYFAKIPLSIREKFTVYILSSSVSDIDITVAKSVPFVTDYIIKPLTRDKVKQLAENWRKISAIF